MSASETKQEGSSPSPPVPTKKSADNKKRHKKKKKHISKHVLKAKSEAKATTAVTNTGSSSSSKKKSAANETGKDPSEASSYLKAWQAKEGWKFNKNTQSWLLRHMYETEKVSKSAFTILLEYMKGLQGKDAKKRVLEEATARAKRYRDYEKAKEATAEAEKGPGDGTADTKESEGVAASTSTDVTNDDDGSYGLEHWNALDDYDKRKEYKRARRVLEVLTADAS